MKINPDTFCGATWFQVRNRQDMTKTVCCLVDYLTEDPGTEELSPIEYLNTPKMVNMRQQMAEGIKVPQCQECWKHEQHGDQSYRQQINKFLEGPWLNAYFKNKTDYNTDLVLMSDIKVGNTCNFACVMCNPTDSSMIYNSWIKDQTSEFVQEYLKNDPLYLEKAKATGYKQTKYREYVDSAVLSNKHIKMIKLLGGEPLLDKKLLEQLSSIPIERKRKITLQVVTNGSMDLLEKTKELKDFKNILYCVSLEGIGDTQDYARYGSDWKQIEQNILRQLEYNPKSINILTCLQATTITKIGDLINWANQFKIPFALGELEYPYFLGITAVPDQLKQDTVKILKTVENYFVSDNSESVALDIKSLIDFITDSRYNKKMHKQFINYLKFYEKDKSLKTFTDVFPEWRPYFEV